MVELRAIAESDEHAHWMVEHHVGTKTERSRCPICETWWPCDQASLAALAVLRAAESALAQRENQALRELLEQIRTLDSEMAEENHERIPRSFWRARVRAVDKVLKSLSTAPDTSGAGTAEEPQGRVYCPSNCQAQHR